MEGVGISVDQGVKFTILIDISRDMGSLQKEEDFDLNEGDVMKEMIDGVPSIKLSERVHEFIAK